MIPTINNQSNRHFTSGPKICIFLITQVSVPLEPEAYLCAFLWINAYYVFIFFVLNGQLILFYDSKGPAVDWWLEHTIRSQRVKGSNPWKVNGGGRKGIRSLFAPELQQNHPAK